ncbi:MAG: hypothetical protein LBS94_00820 [Prevotellaceae bacterium]|nr:hypothetical protein [Prevotellaceae bacterium]
MPTITSDNTMLYTRGCCCKKLASGELAARQVESCQKLATHDWLAGMHNASLPADLVEVRFKNTRKGYYKNVNEIILQKGDIVAVEAAPGHDIGIVSLTGDVVPLQMMRNGSSPARYEFKKVYRKVKSGDIEKWNEAIALEHPFMIRSRHIASDLQLKMKIGDVEVQGDKTKAIFYYIADERVDFRELIKVMADEFRLRIEMRQIGARQEAGRIGGIGTCGRELCCAKWQCSFASVSTMSARHQDIAINQQKLAGQCGKLKCCLNYEVACYIDAQKDFPKNFDTLELADGTAYYHKMDIFKRIMWYNFDKGSMENLVAVPVDRVKEILEINKNGGRADALLSGKYLPKEVVEESPEFTSDAGTDSITRFDRPRYNNRHGVRSNDGYRRSSSNGGSNRQGTPAHPHSGGNPQAAPRSNRPYDNNRPQDSNRPHDNNRPHDSNRSHDNSRPPRDNNSSNRPLRKGGENPKQP